LPILRNAAVFGCGACLAASLTAAPPARPHGIEVLTSSESTEAEINLKPLEPLSPAMRAILAFYAMRANSGCPPGEWSGDRYRMQCPLTTALGLGDQCSDEHIALVRKWFKDGIPPVNLDKAEAVRIGKSGKFEDACNATPYTATHQTNWLTLRVERKKPDLMTVEASGAGTSGPEADSGFFTDVTTYRILPDRVKVVSHREE
jgi:hypothetical protein